MNLRQLHYFVAMAELGSASRAAEKLYVAPTAVSMSLAQLETEFGGRLFVRSSRPMPLTALGRYVLPRAKDLLAQASRLEHDARHVASARQGWLGIGFTRSVMSSVLPAAVRRFRRDHPDVRLELIELLSEHQAVQIANGTIHVGIARSVDPVTTPVGFRIHPIFCEPLYAALPADIEQISDAPITLQDLAKLPFISYPRDPSTRYAAQVLAAAERLGTPLHVQHDAMEIHTALGLVAAGLGATLVGASVARGARPDVSFHPVEGLDVGTTVEAILPLIDQNPYAAGFLLAFIDAASELGIVTLAGRDVS